MSGFFTSEGNVRPRSSRGRSENSGGGKSSFDFFSWNDNSSAGAGAAAAKVGCVAHVCVCVCVCVCVMLFGVGGSEPCCRVLLVVNDTCRLCCQLARLRSGFLQACGYHFQSRRLLLLAPEPACVTWRRPRWFVQSLRHFNSLVVRAHVPTQ